ncbi:MAG: electron transfer flavoprotein subunit beta/FixA family protein [Cellvibrio sp.]|uniref:electron transfer flavoprotein subunit beta/FixA family protein n=1 Tax=Cellvibrio sp. TaxID=1965322 RepID=UPI00271A1F7E|nr:electron transfer flavoprotein subunit beta/FixA family protein [Cellvibrio sp.]
MKVLVAVKHAIDYNVKPNIDAGTGQVELAQVKKAINPFDEISLEEAVRLKERGLVSEIVAVSIGSADAKDSLRHVYALGADRTLLIETDVALHPLVVAKLLKVIVAREQPQLIFLGKQAVGEDYGQTGQMLAALLGVGVGTFTSAIQLNGDQIVVTREVDKGTQTLALKLPAVVTSDLRLNEPRFIKLPNLMMAKKKTIETVAASELDVDLSARFETISAREPQLKPGAIQLANVQELVAKLRQAEVLQ